MRKIKEISRLTGWSDAYIRFLNTEIRRAGYNLIGTHEGMCLSDSGVDAQGRTSGIVRRCCRLVSALSAQIYPFL